MLEESSDQRDEVSRQPHVIYNLGIGYEPLEDDPAEEEVLDEESEPSPQEIQMSLVGLMGVPYEFQDFDDSHLILARVLSVTPDGDPSVSLIYEIFDNLCDNFSQRVEDADHHIYSAPIIIQEREDPQVTYDLGVSHKDQFKREGKLADLERCISCMRKTVEITEETDPELPRYLFGLADSLFERFERFSGIEFLEDAINYQRRAISLVSHPKKKNSSHLPDLDRAIELYEKALNHDLDTDLRASIANNIGSALQLKYLHLIDTHILKRAIEYQTEAVELTSDRNIEKPRRLTNLGNSLHTRFEHIGNTADIHSAISHQLDALGLLPKKHILRAGILNDLGKSYLLCFGSSGKPADIEQSFTYLLEAVELTPVGDPDRPKRLFNLGHALRQKFESQGRLADIDQSITVYYEAASLMPKGHMDRAEHLGHLGSAYLSRFERLDELADLDTAIEHYRAAILIYGGGNKKAQASLNNLGAALYHRFRRLGRIEDIDESITVLREAAELSAKQSNTPVLLNSLAVSLSYRYMRTKQLEDISESVSSLELAIELTPNDHPDMPLWLNSLRNSLQLRCSHTGSRDDLEKAIEHQTKAVHLIPKHHSERPAMLRSLGDALELRYSLTDNEGAKRDEVTIDAYRQAALSNVGNPLERFEAAYSWAQAMSLQGESPLEAYRIAFMSVPQVVWMGTKIDQRYIGVTRISRLTNRAVASAIAEGEYALALEWFEEGRSIVWRQMLDLRTPLDELRGVDQSLAEELERVARALDQAGSSKPARSISQAAIKSLEQAAQSHHRLAEEWDKLLAQVRQIEGLSDFLKPKKASTLMKAARDGPVIAINVHATRCDALVLGNKGTSLDCVPLPRLSYQKALDVQKQLMRSLSLAGVRDRTERRPFINDEPPEDELKEIVEFIWTDVVHPILDHLQYLDPKPGDELPHITWCATGPLAFLPLHAAGRYTDPSPKSRIFNYAVSSYTPTLNGLLAPPPSPDAFSGILAVGQASTPGLSALPGTKHELESIARHAKSLRLTQLVDQAATPSTVLHALSTHSWVHFACHASQVPEEPTSSAFYLHTGTLDLNTITKQSLRHKAFAFLSACQTATGDVDLPEEAVHLAAGMIMAGYPTVVATMWSIQDNDAPLVAERMYAEMVVGDKPDSTKACRALHRALGVLRDKVGEDAFVSWVPYIHLGI
ncbi:hypothetical protein RSAG8_07658, partial [Rhizoctonia solani AG-8 WAC10335]